MIDALATYEGRIAKVQGPARSGKTQVLIQRCATLLAQGVSPDSILVEVSSTFAAQAFRNRLRQVVGTDLEQAAKQVHIQTALSVCTDVLQTPAARQATKRTPRLLNDAEYNFFLEDMKTLGTPIRRLRSMLNYFYQQMSACAPKSEWALGGEEETTLAHMNRILTLRDAMLVQEAPYLCADFLQSADGEAYRAQYAYVLCDDYQNMSRAEQTCLCLLAQKQLLICGNPNQQQKATSDFPYAQGFIQFDVLRRNVEVFTLTGSFAPEAIRTFTDELFSVGDMDAAFRAQKPAKEASTCKGALDAVKWNTPEDELVGLTKYLRVLMDAPDTHESRTCVLVPNKRWALMAQQALHKRGFLVSGAGGPLSLSGDPRDSSRAKSLLAYTKLNLLAHPHDMVAWRSWCGFDNYLTNSDAWMGLQDFATKQKISLYDALKAVAQAPEAPFLKAHVLANRWREGQEFISKNAQRTGFALMRAIGGEGLPEFEAASDMMVGDEDAQALLALESACLSAPTWPDNPHVIHVATYNNLCGTEYDQIFVLAAVDGFIPARDAFEVISTEENRARFMNEERRLFANAVSKATKHAMISFFSKAPLELAERTKMQVVRVRAEEGERIAVVRATSFLSEAGNACPSTLSGQCLLAEQGLA